MIKLIFGTDGKIDFLSSFLDWYSANGVDQFLVNIINKEPEQVVDKISAYSSKYNIKICCISSHDYDGLLQREQRVKAQNKYTDKEDWVLFADLDEFHVYPYKISTYLSNIYNNKNQIVLGSFVDRFARNKELKKYNPNEDIFTQYPMKTYISENIGKVPGPRVVAIKGVIQDDSNHFYKNPKLFRLVRRGKAILRKNVVSINHFKWCDGVIERMEQRLKDYSNRKIMKADRRECKRFLDYLKENRND